MRVSNQSDKVSSTDKGLESSKSARTSKTSESTAGAKSAKSGKADSSLKTDKVEVSSRGKEAATAKAEAGSAPDVREDKVADIRRRIASGQYKVDEEAVAGKMLDEHIRDSF